MFGVENLDIRRLALNMKQIETYNPPPNPAKETDARFQGYMDKFGDESWELDALEPAVLASLVDDEIDEIVDKERWKLSLENEAKEKQVLRAISERYEEVKESDVIADLLKDEPEEEDDDDEE